MNMVFYKTIGKTKWQIIADKSNCQVLLKNNITTYVAYYYPLTEQLLCSAFPFPNLLSILENSFKENIKDLKIRWI
jgi:hypothetical protein